MLSKDPCNRAVPPAGTGVSKASPWHTSRLLFANLAVKSSLNPRPNPPLHRPDTGSTHLPASPRPLTPADPRDSPPESNPTASHTATPHPSQDQDRGTAASAPAVP